ncbi:MAG: hypothetical protein NZ693_09395 [Thermoflexales bacterium]|nr:hypothetical protein [Thermoflexales bacterium]
MFAPVLICVLATLLVSCTGETPEAAAQAWFDAVMNTRGADMLARTCTAKKEEVKELGADATLMKLGVGLAKLLGLDVQIDTSDLRFSSTWQRGREAEVKVHGVVRVSVLGVAEETSVDEAWLMVKEGDMWKWCGSR